MKKRPTSNDSDQDSPPRGFIGHWEPPPKSVLDKFRFTKDKASITKFDKQPSALVQHQAHKANVTSSSSPSRSTDATSSSDTSKIAATEQRAPRRLPWATSTSSQSSLEKTIQGPVTPRSNTPPERIGAEDQWDWFDERKTVAANTLVPQTPIGTRSNKSRLQRSVQTPSSDPIVMSDPIDVDDMIMIIADSDEEAPKRAGRPSTSSSASSSGKVKPVNAASRLARRAIILSPTSSPAMPDQRDDNASSQSSSSSISSFAKRMEAFRFNSEGSNWIKKRGSQAVQEEDRKLSVKNVAVRNDWKKASASVPTTNGKASRGSVSKRDHPPPQILANEWSSGSELEEVFSDGTVESVKPAHVRDSYHPPGRGARSRRTRARVAIVESSAEEQDSEEDAEWAGEGVESPVKPASKRRRLTRRAVVDDEEDKEDKGYDDEKENIPMGHTGSSPSKKGGVDMEFDELLARLQEMFPDHSLPVIRRALEKGGGRDVESAVQALTFDFADLSDNGLSDSEEKRKGGSGRRLASKTRQSSVLESEDDLVEVANLGRHTSNAATAKDKGKTLPNKRDDHEKQQAIVLSDSEPEIDSGSGSDVNPSHHGGSLPPTPRNTQPLEARTLLFFNTSSSRDLQDLTGCSLEQADQLVFGMRPFDSLEDLRTRLKRQRGMGEKILNGYNEMMEGYEVVDQIIAEIEAIGEVVRQCVSVWQGGEERAGGADAEVVGEENHDQLDEETGVDLIEIKEDESGAVRKAKSRVYADAMQGFLREQPAIVSSDIKLKGYQVLGINWLLLLYRKEVSGILADEMGLGKTAQVISFLGRLYELGEMGPHMIIVPSSTLENWMREFDKFCPTLVVKAYYGSQQERLFLRDDLLTNRNYQVLVTTYNMATGHKDDRSFLRRLRCKTMILDEGHMVKNCASARYKHLMSLKSPFRLLLTGTPLQNNLQELVSLLTFIMPNMFSENEDELRKVFKIKAVTSGDSSSSRNMSQLLSRQRILRAKRMMAPFVLRRKKAQVLKDLPSKTERVEQCSMTDSQRELYERLVAESKQSYETAMEEREEAKKKKGKGKGKGKAKEADRELDSLKNGTSKKTEKMANILMQLRKAADHPLLFRVRYTDVMLREMAKTIKKEEQYWDANTQYIFEDMQVMSDFELRRLCLEHKSIERFALKNEEWMHAGKVEKLKKMLTECKGKGDRVLLFSQFTMMLDILEAVLETMGIQYLRLDGQSKVEDRQSLIDAFNDDPDVTVFLLSTKAGGFGINLTSANVVILYDLDFNPHNDKQAEDRAHRVGQTRDVTVIKLISERTIEEQILRMAEVKLRLDYHVSSSTRKDGDDDDEEGGEGSAHDNENIVSLVRSALLAT